MNLPLFIAQRIYKDKGDQRKVSRPAIRIATVGVAIGLAVMIITISVVLGFKHSIRDKVVGFGSHIQLTNFLSSQSTDQYPVCIDDSVTKRIKSLPGIKHIERYVVTQGILKTDADFLGVVFKGIGPEYDLTFLRNNLVAGKIPTFSDKASKYQLMLSKNIADKLQLNVGDKIFAYFIDTDNVRTRRFTIAAIYQTNMSQFDETLCFTDLYTARKLNGWYNDQCSGAEILVQDFDHLDIAANQIIKHINRTTDAEGNTFTSQTIYEAYPQIFTWLDLLDINVWIILALMTAVAGFTMISGLLIIILERTQMIGVLKAIGGGNRMIRHTFLWFAVFIIGRGMFWGNLLGIGLVFIQRYTGIISLDPTTYYVSTAPVELNIPFILLLNIATLLISVAVLIFPSFLISHIHPAKSMRYE